MSSDSITEAAFLLTELRYTLGQLHVQVLDLDASQLDEASEAGRTVTTVVQEMAQHEAGYQKRIAGLLRGASTSTPAGDAAIPLPVSQSEQDPGPEHDFEQLRADTIAMLEPLGDAWPSGVLDLVREQVQQDRQMTTEIADLRMRLYHEDERPDLDEPLTRHPEPHQLEHS